MPSVAEIFETMAWGPAPEAAEPALAWLDQVLAEHDDVDALWYVGTPGGRHAVEAASSGNMKRTWTHLESDLSVENLPADEALREAVNVKNIWIPWGA
jgi:aldehyde dehydrogenase (NAD+)